MYISSIFTLFVFFRVRNSDTTDLNVSKANGILKKIKIFILLPFLELRESKHARDERV